MEEPTKISSKSTMITYGVLTAVSTIVIGVLNYAFGDIYEPHWSVNVISSVVMIAIIVLGIKKYKDGNNGLLSVGESIKLGLGIAIIAALIGMVYVYVFAKFIEPSFIDNVAEVQRVKMIEGNPNLPDEALETADKMTKEYFFAFTFGFIVIFNLFIGLITGLITGLVIKKTEDD
jgi:membrane protein DedA with SNARE-associated domain